MGTRKEGGGGWGKRRSRKSGGLQGGQERREGEDGEREEVGRVEDYRSGERKGEEEK